MQIGKYWEMNHKNGEVKRFLTIMRYLNVLTPHFYILSFGLIAKPWDLYPAACGVTAKHSLSINTPPLGAGSLIVFIVFILHKLSWITV
jgi:hypothetical protein